MKPEAPFSLESATSKINASHEKEFGLVMQALIDFNDLEQLHLGPPPMHPLPIAP